ncbi:Lipopolysaccharide kinase (Kdo/WaaP) family protein [Halopseudomonas yangmingensis]|uniref:Lipopolysaccharide kinase (Kdo/WaaP) family protein n=1 Tax=Halopseudomonas yangmingensis TaxID=1720063 RepID=A0A1I4T123_9GAMM|nr:Lipopolysaccharide kinase (Kdo/WaaP) family protein [Halopseudomonas yangmingensis]
MLGFWDRRLQSAKQPKGLPGSNRTPGTLSAPPVDNQPNSIKLPAQTIGGTGYPALMRYLDDSTYQQWLKTARVLEQDGHGLKVLALADGSIVKLFRIKRLLTSQRLYPQAKRFARNAEKLQALGISCPSVIATWKLKTPPRNLVHYHPLPGETLRDLRKRNPEQWHALLPALGAFIAKLHDRGVYFRSLHLGNIVMTPEGTLGLIDIADMRFNRRRLSHNKRSRNLQHLLRYTEDWAETTCQELAEAYCNASANPKHITLFRCHP